MKFEVRLKNLIVSALFSLEEAAAFTVKDVVDEEFELKKRMIEAELKEIDDTYNSSYNEGILATKIIEAAESIQDLAHSFGNAEVDLSSNINSLKKIKSEKERTPQKTNSKILGIPLRLHIYNMARENKDSIFDSWLKKKPNRNRRYIKIFSQKQRDYYPSY